VALIRLMNIKMQRNETAEAEKLIEKVLAPLSPSLPPSLPSTSFFLFRLLPFPLPSVLPRLFGCRSPVISYFPRLLLYPHFKTGPNSRTHLPPPLPPFFPRSFLPSSSQAKRAAPRNADVVAAYAEFLLMQGKVEEAGKELEKSIRLDPSNPMPHINKVCPPSLKGPPPSPILPYSPPALPPALPPTIPPALLPARRRSWHGKGRMR